MAGLIYQVAWTRLLTLSMGHTTAAASTVVAAFLGGLGVGAMIGGPVAERRTPRGALRLYAGLEAAVLGSALILPAAIGAVEPLLAWAYTQGDAPGALFGIVRLLTCFALVLVPALALGATFPAAIRGMDGLSRPARDASGLLYAANTCGAAAGAAGAGFLLLPHLGTRGTIAAGMLATSAAVAAALVAARTAPDHDSDPAEPAPPRSTSPRPRSARSARPAPSQASSHLPIAALILALTGVASIVYEIVWSRLLAMLVGPTTYAVAASVATMVSGLGIGAGLGSWLAAQVTHPARWLALLLLATAASVPWIASTAGGPLPLLVAEGLAETPASAAGLLTRHLAVIVALMAPPALGAGLAFPLALTLAAGPRAGRARRVGLAYGVNTLASVAGALAAGFLLIPWAGLQTSLLLVGGALTLAGAAATVPAGLPAALRWPAFGAAAALVALPFWSTPWDQDLLASGVYTSSPAPAARAGILSSVRAGRLLYYKEGAAATVSVKALTGNRSLAIDGKVDASDAGDMLTQALLAHVPLLLHPQPSTALIIGLGSGVTLGSALTHPVIRVDVAELSPEVIEASRLFSGRGSHPLDDPRARLIRGDGRSHLLMTDRRYDVIVSEPSNPWMAGVSALFTQEFFAAARSRLAPGGVMCQWAHTYDISADDLQSIVATFLSVFPEGTLWLVGAGDLLLVGAEGPLDTAIASMADTWTRPGVAADLARVSVQDPYELWTSFLARGRALAAVTAGARIQRDDRMALEFSGPGALNHATAATNLPWLRAAEQHERPPAVRQAMSRLPAAHWRHRGTMLQQAGDLEGARVAFTTAVGLDPTDPAALEGFLHAAAAAGDAASAVDTLRAAAVAHPMDVAIRVALAQFLAAVGAPADALAVAVEAWDRNPQSRTALEQIVALHAEVGHAPGLTQGIAALTRLAPASPRLPYFMAQLRRIEGRLPEALDAARAAAARDPGSAAAHNLLGVLAVESGARDSARAAFSTARRIAPRDIDAYVNLGLLHLESGDTAEAAESFLEALALDPSHDGARTGLARSLGRAAP